MRVSPRFYWLWRGIGSFFAVLLFPLLAHAMTNYYLTGSSSVNVGDDFTVKLYANTNGGTINSFDVTAHYDAGAMSPVTSSIAGSVITIPISTFTMSGGSGTLTGGIPGAGSSGVLFLASATFHATTAGSTTFTLSDAAAVSNGVSDTTAVAPLTVTINAAATPPPTAAATPTPAKAATPTPKAATKVVATPPPSTPKPQEQAATPTPTPANTPVPSAAAPVDTIPPTSSTSNATAAPSGSAAPSNEGKRTIATAFSDLFRSIRDFPHTAKDTTGLVAILVSSIPVLGLSFGLVYFIYRLYLLERRRKRTLDRLFEMELNELAALEGKMDLLGEKGAKGREQYREEFKRSKDTILRQLRPDYGQPAGAAPAPETPAPS